MRPLALMALLAMLLAACQAQTTLTLPDGATSAEAASGEGVEGAAGQDVASGGATGAPSPADVYEAIATSIVFVETDDGTGTGVVIEGGWILTNAHVVEREAEVRIGRGDGVDLGMQPVFSADVAFDLALVGPIDDPALVPFERVPTAGVRIGDPVMLLGYPDEVNLTDPTPTLTQGIVSRRRHLAVGDYPFLQVDATIAPGQSGGALVDAQGRLIGISGLEFGEGEFGLVFEGDAVWPRVDRLLSGPSERVPATEPGSDFTEEIGPRRTAGYLLEVGPDGLAHVEASADGEDDVYIDVRTLGGFTFGSFDDPDDAFVTPPVLENEESFFVDEFLNGAEEFDAAMPPGEYLVIIGTFAGEPHGVEVFTRTGLRPFPDVEEAATLAVDEVVEGIFDWHGDSDQWLLPLRAGDQVTIVADGISDMVMTVRLDGTPIASNDDDFIGLYGWSSRVEFTADASGTYEVEIGSFDESRWGYLVEVTVS